MGALFGAKSGSEKALSGSFNETLPELGAIGNLGKKTGKKAYRQGFRDLGDVGDFFSTLLKGDRTAVGQVLAPEIQAVKDQYDATKRSLAEYGPRGGGQVGALGTLAGREAGDIGQLFSGARQRGAAGLGQVGQALGGLGLGGLNLASSSVAGQLQSILGEQGIESGITQRKQAALGGLGSLIGSFIPLP